MACGGQFRPKDVGERTEPTWTANLLIIHWQLTLATEPHNIKATTSPTSPRHCQCKMPVRMTRTGTQTNPHGWGRKRAESRNRKWSYSFGGCSRVIPSRTGQLSKRSRFKTIMTSLGHKRTGQTEKGADSAPPLPTLPPSCPQLTQTSAICLSVQAAKNQIKTKLSPALKIHRSDWIWGSSEANTPAAKWHHCSEHTNKIINIHRKKSRTNKEHAGIILC